MKTSRTQNLLAAALVGALALSTTALFAQDAATDDKAAAAELAKKLSNPVAALISVPFQNNFDFGAGPTGDGFQYKVNVQSVIPVSLNEKLKRHLAHDCPHRLPGEHLRHLQPVRFVGHRAEFLLLAQSPDKRRLDLGCGAGLSAPDRQR